jgi:hypothetical protein
MSWPATPREWYAIPNHLLGTLRRDETGTGGALRRPVPPWTSWVCAIAFTRWCTPMTTVRPGAHG